MSLTSYRAAPPRVKPWILPSSGEAMIGRSPVFRVSGVAATSSCGLAAQAEACMRREENLVKPCIWQTWQRPTLPCLETKYHRRRGVSRPSSEWDRVQPPRNNHQVGEMHVNWSFPGPCGPCRHIPFAGEEPPSRMRRARAGIARSAIAASDKNGHW